MQRAVLRVARVMLYSVFVLRQYGEDVSVSYHSLSDITREVRKSVSRRRVLLNSDKKLLL